MQKDNVQDALNATGFSACNFTANGSDECDRCLEAIPLGAKVYFESTCYENDEGNYYCEPCLLKEPERIIKENNDLVFCLQENNII